MSNCHIIVMLLNSACYHSHHCWPSWNHHLLSPWRHKRPWINETISHSGRRRRHCSCNWGFLRPVHMPRSRNMTNTKHTGSKLTKRGAVNWAGTRGRGRMGNDLFVVITELRCKKTPCSTLGNDDGSRGRNAGGLRK